MDILTFRAVEFPPMRVAWRKVLAWCHSNGLLRADSPPRLLGYDSRGPMAGATTAYGYEAWPMLRD